MLDVLSLLMHVKCEKRVVDELCILAVRVVRSVCLAYVRLL